MKLLLRYLSTKSVIISVLVITALASTITVANFSNRSTNPLTKSQEVNQEVVATQSAQQSSDVMGESTNKPTPSPTLATNKAKSTPKPSSSPSPSASPQSTPTTTSQLTPTTSTPTASSSSPSPTPPSNRVKVGDIIGYSVTDPCVTNTSILYFKTDVNGANQDSIELINQGKIKSPLDTYSVYEKPPWLISHYAYLSGNSDMPIYASVTGEISSLDTKTACNSPSNKFPVKAKIITSDDKVYKIYYVNLKLP